MKEEPGPYNALLGKLSKGVKNGNNNFEVREKNYLIPDVNIESPFKSISEFLNLLRKFAAHYKGHIML